MWRFRDESSDIPLRIDPVRARIKRPFPKLSAEQVAKRKQVLFEKYARPVYQFRNDGSFVKEFPSIKDAADYYKLNRNTIYMALAGRKETVKGYIWKYKIE